MDGERLFFIPAVPVQVSADNVARLVRYLTNESGKVLARRIKTEEEITLTPDEFAALARAASSALRSDAGTISESDREELKFISRTLFGG